MEGNVQIYDRDGNCLSSHSVTFYADPLLPDTSSTWSVDSTLDHTSVGEALWNLNLSDLQVRFKIAGIYYIDEGYKSFYNDYAIIKNFDESDGETPPITDDGGSNTDHIHVYDKQSTDAAYLLENANCKNPATYSYSCSCGEKGPSAEL